MTSENGIDTATFLIIVSSMGGAIVTLAGLLWREREARSKVEIKLAAYESSAPELVAAIRDWIAASERSSKESPRSRDLPSPLSHSPRRITPRKRPHP